MNEKLINLINKNYILNNHTDGSCFKLQIEYTDFKSYFFEKHIKFCEDFNKLLEYAIEYRNYQENELGRYIIDFRIQDDSK